MNWHDKASKILELLDRPPADHARGMANLSTLTDSELDVLLHDIERDTRDIAGLVYGWLNPKH